MSPARLIRLYPGWWRRRYGDEMRALMDERPPARGDILDLARGVADAWLHPDPPSWLPPIAALAGGGLWTSIAAAIAVLPSPPDWPGYVVELLPMAIAAAILLLVAALGCALRSGDDRWRAAIVAAAAVGLGSFGWIVALALTLAGVAEPATLAATQALAMLGMVAVGLVLIRSRDSWVGALLVVGAAAMLAPWIGGWLIFGGAWTAIGIVLVAERFGRPGRGLRPA